MGHLSDPAASRAVLVGTHRYRHLEDIPAVRGNLTRLGELLRDPGLCGLPEDRCTTLVQPTRDEVLDAVHEAARDAPDTLVLYFAGHGLTDPYTGELYLALEDSERGRLYKALRYEYVRQLLIDAGTRAQGPRRKVVVLDCCWSGLALGGAMAAPEVVGARAGIEGTFVLTATAETRQALARPGEPYTVFTGELIKAVAEGVPGGSELLTMSELYGHLAGSLAARSLPVPQQRNRNTAGHIAVLRNLGYREPEPEVAPGDGAGDEGDGGAEPEVPQSAVPVLLRNRAAVYLTSAMVALIGVLMSLWIFFFDDAPSLCASGRLTLTGSTAFAPVLREAANSYRETCPEVRVEVDANGGRKALSDLADEGDASPSASDVTIAFAEGYSEQSPQLIPSPLGFSVLTFYVHQAVAASEVDDLSKAQLRDLYRGDIANWKEVGGPDLPVQLVNRPPGSSSGQIMREKILDGELLGGSDACPREGPEPGPVNCEIDTAADALSAVANHPGAIGYGPVEAVAGVKGVRPLRIDGERPTTEATDYGKYDFWATTYAYTYRRPASNSPAAKFLEFLEGRQGRDIMAHEHFRSCAALKGATPCRYR